MAADPPRDLAEVVGLVSWWITARGALRWSAGHGVTDNRVCRRVPDPNQFSSRAAAVRWVRDQVNQDAQG